MKKETRERDEERWKSVKAGKKLGKWQVLQTQKFQNQTPTNLMKVETLVELIGVLDLALLVPRRFLFPIFFFFLLDHLFRNQRVFRKG